MNRKAQLGTNLMMKYMFELVTGVIVAFFFIYAAHSYVQGLTADKSYLANDMSRMMQVGHGVSGNAYIAYEGKIENFNTEIKSNQIIISERKGDTTGKNAFFVPGKNDVALSAKGKLIFQRVNGDVFFDTKIESLHFRQSPQKSIDNVIFVYDDNTKEYVNKFRGAIAKSKITSVPDVNENNVYLIFRFVDDIDTVNIYYSSLQNTQNNLNLARSSKLSLSNYESTMLASDDSELAKYSNAIIIEQSANFDIRNEVVGVLGDLYNV